MVKYKKPRRGKNNQIYNIDELNWHIEEYQQRADRKIKAIIINSKPLTKRDKIKFICTNCGKDVELFTDKLIKRNGEKLCKECAITVYHKRNPDWLILTEEQRKAISERNSGPKITETEIRVCSNCGREFKVRLIAHEKNKRYCSKKCNIENWADYGKKNGGQYGYLGSKPFYYRTKPEKYFKNLLEHRGISFKHQKFVKINDRMHSFDFWFENCNTFVEIDGDYWHYNLNKFGHKKPNEKQINRMKLDEEKNEYCRINSIRLIRIWASELEEKAEKILEEVF